MEAASKKKRGRPAKYLGEPLHRAAMTRGKGQLLFAGSDRSKANGFYEYEGLQWIWWHFREKYGETQEYVEAMKSVEWIYGEYDAKNDQMDMKHRKKGICEQLGRCIGQFDSDGLDFAVETAQEICAMEPKPRVKDVVRYIRRWRIGPDKKKLDGSTFYLRMARAVDDYIDRYPDDYDLGRMADALYDLSCLLHKQADEQEPA